MNMQFLRLLDERSMTAMDLIIEQNLPLATANSPERDALLAMLDSNDLDKRHLICAEYLGREDHAQQLRAWIAKKRDRQQKKLHN